MVNKTKFLWATVLAVLMMVGVNWAASISGSIHYEGTSVGKIFVEVAKDPPPSMSLPGVGHVLVCTGTGNYDYRLDNNLTLLSSVTYYVWAYLDTNTNGIPDPNEAKGQYGGAVSAAIFIDAEAVGGKNFTIAEIGGGKGSIEGNITYTGSSVGNFKVFISTYSNYSTPFTSAVISVSGTGYRASELSAAAYYLYAYIDKNYNNNFDAGEPRGFYNGTIFVQNGMITFGKDVTITDPISASGYTLRGRITDNSNSWPPVAVGGVEVSLYDTKGQYDSSKFTLIVSTQSFSSWVGNDQYSSYNYEFTGIYPSSASYAYVVKARKEGYVAQPKDLYVYFNNVSGGICFAGDIRMDIAPDLHLSNVSVDNGVESGDTVIITPDNDGSKDFANINFRVNASTTNFWGAQCRVIIDSNGDDIYAPFDWSTIQWDNGNPMQNGEKLSWDQLNNLQSQADWSFENYINQGEISATGYVDKKIRWEGRDNRWNVLPGATYNASIQLGFDLRETFNSSSTVHITVQTVGISGNIYYDAGGSTLPVVGARVEAGGMSGWGQAFTDSNGLYKIGGLRTGAYFIRVEAKGFSGEERQNVAAPSDDVNFALSKGGLVSGNVTLPTVYAGTVDPYSGNLMQELWGNVEARDETTGKNGFTNFQIRIGTNTAAYSLTLAPGTYRVRAQAPGYVAKESTGVVVTSYGSTVNLALGEAIKIQGTVAVSTDTVISQPLWVNVNARSLNNRNFGWGGTQILPGRTSAQFEINNLPPDDSTNPDYKKDNTYELRFNAQGYADSFYDSLVEVSSSMVILPNIVTFSKGETISGTITFNGDTTQLSQGGGNNNNDGPSYIWLNVHGMSNNQWSGMQVAVPKSSTGCVTSYEIAGLSSGVSYEINCWVMGFELEGQRIIAAAPNTGTNLVFNAYNGKISGTVTTTAAMSSFSVDNSKVMVTAQLSWWGQQSMEPLTPKGGVDSAGKFVIEGLGTGEYIVTANEYEVLPSSNPPFFWQGKPSGQFAAVIDRVMVANGGTTEAVLELNTPASISGTITDNSSSTTTAQGLRVQAVPQKMAWMGMQGSFAMNNAPAIPKDGTTNVYQYNIGGLPSDTYIVTPFVDANRDGKMDLAVVSKVVGLGLAEAKTAVDFSLTNGFTITGSVQRPQVDEYNHYYGIELYQSGKSQETLARAEIQFIKDDYRGINTLSDRSQNFSFEHIASGNYNIRIWSNGDYKQEAKKVEVTDQDVTVPTIILGKGATIKGYLVDAESGEAVSGKQGARVRAEARPWIEGGWLETNTMSGGDPNGPENPLKINEQSGLFQLPNLPAGNYQVSIQFGSFDPMSSASSSKNYAGTVLAGITVPDSTDEVDVGTIKLKAGKTIDGTVSDKNGNRLANILMIAQPSTSKGESIRVETKTDATGYYALRGINPEINRWQVQAAARGDWMEMRPSRYGEMLKDSIIPGTTGVDFILEEAKARANGKIVAPAGVELGLPYSGEDLPCAVVLFQKAGEIYDDPMGGVEIVTNPDGRFEVGGLVPGNYIIKVMSKGLSTKIVEKTIAEGANNLGNIDLAKGGSVSGTILDKQGNKVSTSLLGMAVAVEEATFGLTFGILDTNDLTKEVNGYQVTGLVPGKDYRIVLGSEDGGDDDLFVSTSTVRISSVDEAATLDLVYEEQPPSFIIQVLKTNSGTAASDNKFKVKVFITKVIADTDATKVLTVAGNGTFNDSDNVDTRLISDDKQNVEGVYSAGEVNGKLETSFTLTITAKDLKNSGATVQYVVNTGMKTQNQGRINPLLGGTVKVGEGDSSSIYVPSGAPDVPTSTDTVTTTVSSVEAGDTIKAGPRYASEYYSFVLPVISYANTPGDVKSDVYDMEMKLASGVLAAVKSGKTVKVGCEYDNVSAEELDKLDMCYYDEANDVWVKETTNRSVDETNGALSVDVSHLTRFAVFLDLAAPAVPTGFSAYAVDGDKASLSWTAVSANDLAGYNIYRSTEGAEAGYTKIASVAKTVTSYTDTGLEKARTYYYKVSAYDDASTPNESALSAAKSVIGAYLGPFRTYVYPNPWKPGSDANLHIRYFLPLKTGKIKVEIKIYNLVGELVREFDQGDQDSGETYDLLWDGKNDDGALVASGVYMYHIKAGDDQEIKKIGLIK